MLPLMAGKLFCLFPLWWFERYFLSGVDVNAVDYDGRSALHVAAAEGHTEVIRFLLENAGADASLRDR